MALLEINNMTKTFGGLKAISDVTFSLDKGRIVSIIGPNGAGKTTFFNTLTGIYKPDGGTIEFNGKSLVGLSPDKIAARDIARTFQNIRLFQEMTVVENILVGMHVKLKQNSIQTLFRMPFYKKEESEGEREAVRLMKYVGLKDVGNELAKNLPYGDQRRLEIARALAAEPLLLLLDEPA
jgi:branched-chain amino acid transport system ATP-binding protein